MATAGLLIGLGILCFFGVLLSLAFTVITFANNKPTKWGWLTGIFVSLVGLSVCIFIFVRKTVDKVKDFTHDSLEQFGNYADGLEHSTDSLQYRRATGPQVQLLKSFTDSTKNVPEGFYSYFGFQDYYRFPLPYPYSIHCNYYKNNGELYNELHVVHFDENDNGEIYVGPDNITRLAFDKNWLLLEQSKTSTRSDKLITHYFLFDLATEKQVEVHTEKDLLKLAKEKGYTGTDTLMTIEAYDRLF